MIPVIARIVIRCLLCLLSLRGYPHSSVGKESACNAGDLGLIPGLVRSPGERRGNPLQYSCLENSMNRAAWQATVHEVTKTWARLSDSHTHTHTHTWWGVLWYNPYKVKNKFLHVDALLQRRKHNAWRGCWVLEATDFTCRSTSLTDIRGNTKSCQTRVEPKAVKGSAENLGCCQTALPFGSDDPSQLCLKSKWVKEFLCGFRTSPRGRS